MRSRAYLLWWVLFNSVWPFARETRCENKDHLTAKSTVWCSSLVGEGRGEGSGAGGGFLGPQKPARPAPTWAGGTGPPLPSQPVHFRLGALAP